LQCKSNAFSKLLLSSLIISLLQLSFELKYSSLL
jgi:hypothetical protein